MKVIGFEDIKNLNISPADCYEWVSRMIEQKDSTFLPAKTHMSFDGNRFCNVMPSVVYNMNGVDVGGVKMVTRYPERKPALDSKILLMNITNGDFLALMDGNWITAMRTGAVAAHSVMHLARSGWDTLALIGLGNIARASMLVLLSQINRPIKIKLLRYKDQAELFMERFKDFDNITFTIADSAPECIKDADVVISCATYFENDIASDDCFKEGVLVVPVHTRGFTNCDLFFDKVFADDTGHVDHFKYFSRYKYYAEVSDVVNGKSEGRADDKERILAYNIGISIHDIYYAYEIYNMLKTDGNVFDALTEADMKDPKEKFWI